MSEALPTTATVSVSVRYFASLREALGASESVTLAAGSTLGGLRDALIARGGRHAEALARGRALRCALNQVMADEASPLTAGAEVAFFPPVTGG
ncbi:MAG: MoaD/ThiS family protein [Burkholderiaceae bacterium]|nr:MoaD/ThiS family protein [Burkholderiaceae bacterium]